MYMYITWYSLLICKWTMPCDRKWSQLWEEKGWNYEILVEKSLEFLQILCIQWMWLTYIYIHFWDEILCNACQIPEWMNGLWNKWGKFHEATFKILSFLLSFIFRLFWVPLEQAASQPERSQKESEAGELLCAREDFRSQIDQRHSKRLKVYFID